ncbi:MAG: hypothetical protein ACO24H_10035 [Polynucleobacter sp.]
MARKMRRPDTGTVVTVYSHAITRNFWEYFFVDPKPNSQHNMCAIVMGFETEMGDVHLPEIKPYLLSATSDLHDVMPCQGWEWVD